MLKINQISKKYGIQEILKNISFSVNPGERWGLIGTNGSGKSTLIRIIAGLERPDSGNVQFYPANLQVGYLPQGFEYFSDQTVGEFLDTLNGGQARLTNLLQDLAEKIAVYPDEKIFQDQYADTLARLVTAAENESGLETILAALGLADIPTGLPAARLSGGQKTRLALAGVLVRSPRLLLLDEPTNHLDINMLEWLETWLLKQNGGVLMVSHDRAFLNRTVNGILELDEQKHTLKIYYGNYEDYLLQKQIETQNVLQAYQDQQDTIRHLSRTAEKIRDKAVSRPGSKTGDNDKMAKGFFSDRKLEVMRRAKNIVKRIETMQTGEHIEKPHASYQIKLNFGNTLPSGRDVLILKDLSIGYNQTPLIEHLDRTIPFGARVVLTGQNGSGKTSLLRTLMGELDPLGGEFRFGSQVTPGFMTQELQDKWFIKDPYTTIAALTQLSETEIRRFLSFFLFTQYEVFTEIGQLSYGELSRLSLACLAAQGVNFLLLDEPANHLDIPSRNRFEKALEAYSGTALIISHDRYFNDHFATEIWEINEQKIKVYPRG